MFSLGALLAVLWCAITSVSAQISSEYTDPVSGITFQRFLSGDYGYSFSIALPTTPTNEFIGQLVAPITSGWAGVSFGGPMLDSLLLVAWPYNNEIIHSFRLTGAYELPPVYVGDAALTPDPVLTPICGTVVNSTHWALTFTCRDCNHWVNSYGEVGGFDLTTAVGVMGWAIGADAVDDPSDPASGFIQHTGFGLYGMQLGLSMNANYDTWAACGGGTTTTTTTTSSTTTTSPTVTPTSKPAGPYEQSLDGRARRLVRRGGSVNN